MRVRLFGERDDQAIPLPLFLQDAYEAAQRFCEVLSRRPGLNSGFLETILLRRVGSTIHAGQQTAAKMLGQAAGVDDEDDEAEAAGGPAPMASSLYPLIEAERVELERFLGLLEQNAEEDPKARIVEAILLRGVEGSEPWLDRGCIVFSQYYDSVLWLAWHLSERLPNEPIAIYAGANRSGLIRQGAFTRLQRDTIKDCIRSGEVACSWGPMPPPKGSTSSGSAR